MQPVWRNLLRLDDIPWCRDHVISGDIVFPAAGYIAMAGEAIRQMEISKTGSNTDSTLTNEPLRQGFIVRDLTLTAALSLHASSATEVLFSMRPLRLTTTLDSEWYEFTVASCSTNSLGSSSGSWTKHCAGQVKAAAKYEANSSEETEPLDLPRKIQSSAWYKLMRSVGMEYGPSFQGMRAMSAHPVYHRAVSHVPNRADKADSIYQIHPTALDACIQLFTAAAARGRARSFGKAPLVPVSFGEIYVRRPTPPDADMMVQADATFGPAGGIDGSCFGVDSNTGDLIVKLTNLKLSTLGDGSTSSNLERDTLSGTVLQWKPDIDSNIRSPWSTEQHSHSKLEDILQKRGKADTVTIHLERLALLCAVETIDRLSELDRPTVRTKKYLEQLQRQVNRILGEDRENGGNGVNGEYHLPNGTPGSDDDGQASNEADDVSPSLKNLSSSERVEHIADAAAKVKNTSAAFVGTIMCHLLECVEDIIAEGEAKLFPAELRNGGLSTELLDIRKRLALKTGCAPVIELISHGKPDLRVLEVQGSHHDLEGTSTAAPSSVILDALRSSYREPMFGSYTLAHAHNIQNGDKEHPDIEFRKLNILQTLEEQDFSAEPYDLVMITDVSMRKCIRRSPSY
jgi:acyl transferase domain-containing protein